MILLHLKVAKWEFCVFVCIYGVLCVCAHARMSGACEYITARKQKLHGRKLCACKYRVSCDGGCFRSALVVTFYVKILFSSSEL